MFQSSSAAVVLVTILESWHCWKNSEGESVVTRLFTLEEKERMSCRKCRRMPNYPEQSYYGIVMAADSIRDFKVCFIYVVLCLYLEKLVRAPKMMLSAYIYAACF